MAPDVSSGPYLDQGIIDEAFCDCSTARGLLDQPGPAGVQVLCCVILSHGSQRDQCQYSPSTELYVRNIRMHSAYFAHQSTPIVCKSNLTQPGQCFTACHRPVTHHTSSPPIITYSRRHAVHDPRFDLTGLHSISTEMSLIHQLPPRVCGLCDGSC